jgi:hypothetical protein
MKETFIIRLHALLKERYTFIGKNSNVKDGSLGVYTRKFSVKDDGVEIDFVIPVDDSQQVKVFFTHDKCRPTSILLDLDIRSGEYTFSGIPNSKSEVKHLYLFAEKYMEDIRYIANNALSFIMTKCED